MAAGSWPLRGILGSEEPAGRPRVSSGARGKSGLRRAGCWGDPGGGDLVKAQQKGNRRSASIARGKGETVR